MKLFAVFIWFYLRILPNGKGEIKGKTEQSALSRIGGNCNALSIKRATTQKFGTF